METTLSESSAPNTRPGTESPACIRWQQRTQPHSEEPQIYCPDSHSAQSYMSLTTTVMPSFSRGVLS